MKELELTNTQELSRLLWRKESGLFPEIRIAGIFENEVNRLESLIVEWRPLLRSLKHTPSVILSTCDDAINQAQRSNRAKDYKNGLEQIKRAQGAIVKLREVFEASTACALATEAYRDLETLLDSEHLQQLASIKTLEQLLVEMDTLLAAGISRQAEFIARLFKNKISALVESGNPDTRSIDELQLQISRQIEFCAKTEAFAPSSLVDSQLQRGLERLSQLLMEGRVRLVAHLTEDIEGQLGSRRAVLSVIANARLSAPTNTENHLSVENTKTIIRDDSWEEAATRLLSQSLAAIGTETAELESAIRGVTLRLASFRVDSTATPPETTSGIV